MHLLLKYRKESGGNIATAVVLPFCPPAVVWSGRALMVVAIISLVMPVSMLGSIGVQMMLATVGQVIAQPTPDGKHITAIMGMPKAEGITFLDMLLFVHFEL
ncbi:MAG: hypothetical protein U5L96_07125 [Owenweeksia sp.]|nr:hypothetical protein [Owenweeksia sp.]